MQLEHDSVDVIVGLNVARSGHHAVACPNDEVVTGQD